MSNAILDEIISHSFKKAEYGKLLTCVSSLELDRLAVLQKVRRKELSLLALENGIIPLRYLKNVGTLGIEGQKSLLSSKAAIVGAGGLGSRVAEILARTGVGEITIADPDEYEESNLNRQAFSAEDNLGKPKLAVVKEELDRINKDVDVFTFESEADEKNLTEIIDGAKVVIDALDSIEDRLTLEEACRKALVPLIHAAIAGSYLQVTTIYPDDPGLRYIYQDKAERGKTHGIEEETGNPAVTPAIASAIQANEAVRILTGKEPLLRNKMLFVDLEEMVFEMIDFS